MVVAPVSSSVVVLTVSSVTVEEIGLPSASYSVTVVFVSVTGLPSLSVEVVSVVSVTVVPVLLPVSVSPS